METQGNTFGLIIREKNNDLFLLISQPSISNAAYETKNLMCYIITDCIEKQIYQINQELLQSITNNINSWSITSESELQSNLNTLKSMIPNGVDYDVYWGLTPNTISTQEMINNGEKVEPIDNFIPNAIYYQSDVDLVNICAKMLFINSPQF